MAPRACRRPESSRNAETWKAEGVGPSSPRDRVFPGDKGRLASKETLDGGLGGAGGKPEPGFADTLQTRDAVIWAPLLWEPRLHVKAGQ